MIDLIMIAVMVWLILMTIILAYRLEKTKKKIERAYKLIEAQERRDSGEANFGRASGLDLAMTMLEGEFEWLERWYMG